ncbi:type III secretion system effector phosphothreonine lyase [Chromobacterium sp. ATCC 53434]|uniref:type III secretion system effector phosphothreonine lyase n=1 Tax=Chromobacterium sp. (strain ATCC 53434 / SC 14030) TaxID=2059672 RepID=UPI000C777D25|nr:type III secretion system effector phosphothreonine lyase [Chromobacterium sp. ATCC 53434]AUH51269.1 type III secretion system effector phosphothreonine lyase [Chromobacterium sp. ATCC 53434]
MPIRPKFKLNLTPLDFSAPMEKNAPSAREQLRADFDKLRGQMRELPFPRFQQALHAPDYAGMRQSGFCAVSNGFRMENHGGDVFMHARRENPQSLGEFAGDKFHISIQSEQVPQAFQALSSLLFSDDSPIDKWKITDMERVDHQSRVGVGAQITLYVKPDQTDSLYSALALNKTRQFIENLEANLSEHGIAPGQHPESDVRPDGWRYTSYRNELRSERDGSETQSQALREEPFYRLMTE